MLFFYFLICSFIHFVRLKNIWDDINLPLEHMPYFFNNNYPLSLFCEKNKNCPYKEFLKTESCWGYEQNCSMSNRYLLPICDGDAKGWVTSKKDQIHTFFTQGDFGYIKERKKEFITLCTPQHPDDSFLECTKFTRFCRARNIIFDFNSLQNLPEPIRYRDDVVQEGEVGGHCKLDKSKLKKEGGHKSPLQSWFAELEHFTELSYRPIEQKKCDTIFTKPTFIMKLDAPVNMYHHFCDFLNLYASLHLNNSFTTDVFILIWDTIPYRSNFEVIWKAFTKHPLLNLEKFKGKKVCFKDVVFPLLPRMIFGMYYNMPLIPGCYRSGLFHAFSKHILHKLNIKQDENSGKKIRITLLSRATTYRQILNENELISALKKNPDFIVRRESYTRHTPFIQQLKISHNTDILIGMHGAGLTHMLFQPDWAVVFEIYHCDDRNCYLDLARLRGLKYITWEKMNLLYPEDEGHHPTLGAHAKFTNYAFDVEEFLRLVKIAADHVINHKSFKLIREQLKLTDKHIHNEF